MGSEGQVDELDRRRRERGRSGRDSGVEVERLQAEAEAYHALRKNLRDQVWRLGYLAAGWDPDAA